MLRAHSLSREPGGVEAGPEVVSRMSEVRSCLCRSNARIDAAEQDYDNVQCIKLLLVDESNFTLHVLSQTVVQRPEMLVRLRWRKWAVRLLLLLPVRGRAWRVRARTLRGRWTGGWLAVGYPYRRSRMVDELGQIQLPFRGCRWCVVFRFFHDPVLAIQMHERGGEIELCSDRR